ncbi:hypothetical protein IW148_005195, partial [Coemansia sp. RSA 1199]
MNNCGIENVSKDMLTTNVRLLKSTKMFDKVKAVHITIQANYYSVTSLHLICGEMKKYLKQWPQVIELNLCFGFNYFSGLMADRNINRYQTSMQPYVKTISKLLPRVSKLVLQGAVHCEVLDEWFGDLAIHYSNQLRCLDRDYSIVIDIPPLQTFSMLTSLSVTFGNFANYSTAYAAASQLQQLRIYNISCNVDESLPAVKPTSTILFPELRNLLLEYPRAANVFADKDAHANLPKLKLPYKTLTLNPEDLETLTITHLQIGMVMNSDMVVAFITKLTKLVDIKFTNISTENSELSLANPE